MANDIAAGNVVQQLEDPYIRELRQFLFERGFDFAGNPLPLEAITSQIASFNPLEQRAIDIGAGGIGSYFPYMQRGTELFENAVDEYDLAGAMMKESMPYYNEAAGGYRDAAMLARSGLAPTERGIYEGMNMLQAGLGSFDQRAADNYMNPYMRSVIDDQLSDVDEFYDQQVTDLNTKAAQSGLRGSARAGLLGLEIEKAKQEQRSKLLNQGLASAYDQAQRQFNLEQQALRGAGPVMASLGQGFGQARSGLAGLLNDLSTNIGNVGGNYLRTGSAYTGIPAGQQGLGGAITNLGGIGQAYRGNDISQLMNLGQTARGYEQAVMDTQKQNAYNIAMEPYQRMNYLSGLAGTIPGGTTTFTNSQFSSPNPMRGVAGQTIGADTYYSINPLQGIQNWYRGT